MFFKKATIYLTALTMLFKPGEGDELAVATNPVSVVSAYSTEEELDIYLSVSEDASESVFSCSVSSDVFEEDITSLIRSEDDGRSVDYVFLVNSDSQSETYIDIVDKYTQKILTEDNGATFEVATINQDGLSEITKIDDAEGLTNYIKSIEISDIECNLDAALESVYSHVVGCKYSKSSLTDIVVITDGESDFIPDTKSIADKVDSHKEAIFSYISVGGTIDENMLGAAKGLAIVVEDESAADLAGIASASLNNSLYFVSFPLDAAIEADSFDISVTITDKDENEVYVTQVTNIKKISVEGESELVDASEEENSDEEDASNDDIDEESEISDEDEAQEDGLHSIKDKKESKSRDKDDDDDEASLLADNHLLILIAVCIVGLIIVLILIILVIKQSNKNKKDSAADNNATNNPSDVSKTAEPINMQPLDIKPKVGPAVPLYFELINGQSSVPTGEINMYQELTIGSSMNCDLVFNDSKVSELHAKIYIKNGTFTIEDMNSTTGTYLEGMRIQKTNRLDSGDLISVGDAEFIIKFN